MMAPATAAASTKPDGHCRDPREEIVRDPREEIVRDPREEIVGLIPALRAFARTLCRNATDADDLVQETLTKAIAKIHLFTPGTNIKSWLFTIMRNTFCTNVKIRKRETPASADCASARPAVDPTQEWSAKGRELSEALARLPPSQREILMLIGVMGVSYEDTAIVCGCAMGTVKSRLNRARASLLVELQEDSSSTSVERGTDFSVLSRQNS